MTIFDPASANEDPTNFNQKKDELIGKIYDSSTDPGDWFNLIEAITVFTQPQITSDGLEIHPPPEVVDNLISHLERAARSNDYIHVLEDQKQTLSTIYNNMPWPMVMLDANMLAIDANQAAHQFLKASSPITLHENGSLYFQDRALQTALKRVLNMETGRDVQILHSTSGNLSLLCTPLAKSDAPGTISKLRAVVWIISNENKIIPSVDIIQSVFGLTQAEARLLHLLCKEGSLNECANSLSVSIHTVRSQLKSIMAKTNVSSQVELVSQTMGHSFLQTATQQLQISHQDVEQRVLLPDGRVLSWFEYGNPKGRAVLTLEGLSGGIPYHPPHQNWYSDNNLRIINIVRPGYGTSTLKPDMKFVGFTQDIKYLCNYLNIDKPVMAAYCVGSAYALCAAATETKIFERLGVLGPTVPLEYWELDKLDFMHKLYLQMHRTSPKIFAMFLRLAIRGLRRAPEKGYARIAKSLGGRDCELLNDPIIRERTIRQMQNGQYQGNEIIINEYQWLQESWNIDLAKISIPTLVWHGEADPTISIGSARSMAANIPGAVFRGLPEHGRLLAHDVWRDFLTALLELASVKKQLSESKT